MNRIKAISKANEAELKLGISSSSSWHAEFAHSPFIYIGGIPFELTEGDIITVFSQYGVIEGIKLMRDKDTGKPRGFCFIKYEDTRSPVLAVDNLNGITLLNRRITVNHVKEFKNPEEMDVVQTAYSDSSSSDEVNSDEDPLEAEKRRKRKEEKRKAKKKKEKKREAKALQLMKAAMSQDREEQQRILEKERRRMERREKSKSDEAEKPDSTINNTSDHTKSEYRDEPSPKRSKYREEEEEERASKM